MTQASFEALIAIVNALKVPAQTFRPGRVLGLVALWGVGVIE